MLGKLVTCPGLSTALKRGAAHRQGPGEAAGTAAQQQPLLPRAAPGLISLLLLPLCHSWIADPKVRVGLGAWAKFSDTMTFASRREFAIPTANTGMGQAVNIFPFS